MATTTRFIATLILAAGAALGGVSGGSGVAQASHVDHGPGLLHRRAGAMAAPHRAHGLPRTMRPMRTIRCPTCIQRPLIFSTAELRSTGASPARLAATRVYLIDLRQPLHR